MYLLLRNLLHSTFLRTMTWKTPAFREMNLVFQMVRVSLQESKTNQNKHTKIVYLNKYAKTSTLVDIRKFNQITTAGATTAAVTERVWGE